MPLGPHGHAILHRHESGDCRMPIYVVNRLGSGTAQSLATRTCKSVVTGSCPAAVIVILPTYVSGAASRGTSTAIQTGCTTPATAPMDLFRSHGGDRTVADPPAARGPARRTGPSVGSSSPSPTGRSWHAPRRRESYPAPPLSGRSPTHSGPAGLRWNRPRSAPSMFHCAPRERTRRGGARKGCRTSSAGARRKTDSFQTCKPRGRAMFGTIPCSSAAVSLRSSSPT